MNDIALPEAQNRTQALVTSKGARYVVEEIMGYIEEGMDFFDIKWDVNKMCGVIRLIRRDGDMLELYLPGQQELLDLNVAIFAYYQSRSLREQLKRRREKRLGISAPSKG
jgi:hypothetical protein